MIAFLRNKWTQFLADRAKKREIAPATFALLTQEILELAHLVEKIRPGDHELETKLSRLEQEIEQLQELLKKRTFKKLSPAKRMELKKNLIFSKKQLLEAMGAVPPPTDRLQ
ncbi:hypothetical protein [Desulfoplanes sp.]